MRATRNLRIMTNTDANKKLANYLGDHYGICDLLDLWEKLGGIYSQDETGVAYFLVEWYGGDAILEILSKELIPMLVSEDSWKRQEAKELMEEMGFNDV